MVHVAGDSGFIAWANGVDTDMAADAAALAAHLADTVDAHDATAVSYAGGTGLSATTVEAAIDELADEKLDTATAATTYQVPLDRDRVLRALASPSRCVGVSRVSSTKYRLHQKLAGEFYWSLNLTQLSGLAGSTSAHMLHLATVDQPWLSVDQTDASVVRTGAGWSGPTTQAAAYGGSYHQNNTGTGQDVTWTTPAGVTRVGARFPAVTNAGAHLVEVDGDTTKANLLPTAQTLVDRGQLATTVLVANGGTLNPTDRVLDQYAAATDPSTTIDYDRHVAIADDLAPGVHTVKVTMTGYANAQASGGFRLYDSGWTYGTVDTSLNTASTDLLPHTRLMSNFDSAYEYAVEFLPGSGGSYTFLGNVHGYDAQSSLEIVVDGAVQSLSDGQRAMGSTADIRRVSALKHPNVGAGATTVADVVTTYALSAAGLEIAHHKVWRVAGTIRKNYPAMFPLDGRVFDRGSLAAASADYTLTTNGGLFNGAMASDLIYLWQNEGRLAACLFLPDVAGAALDFANADPVYAAIEDREPFSVNAGDLSKAYVARSNTTTTEAVSIGTAMSGRAVYRVARLDNATAALAR